MSLYSVENLKEIAGDDKEFMAVVAATFLEEIPTDLNLMVDAIDNDNKELAYQFAHKMKPNIEMFGIDLLKQITAIESWTKTSKSNKSIEDTKAEVFQTLQQVFEQLKTDFIL